MQTVCIASRNPFLLNSGGIALAFAAVDRPAAGKWPVEWTDPKVRDWPVAGNAANQSVLPRTGFPERP
jgi:hypothetical protein